MGEATKYILYCGQQANFQTRSMLIPFDLIMRCEQRVKDLQVLRENCLKNIPLNHLGKDYIIDQLLFHNFTFDGNIRKLDTTPYSLITGILSWYADNNDEDCYSDLADKEWYDASITGIASGFNHLANYSALRCLKEYNGEPIEIVEGFLVLETRRGQLSLSSIETVEELQILCLADVLTRNCNPTNDDNKKQD